MPLRVGRISGRALAALVLATRTAPARALLTRTVRAELGIDAVRALGREARGQVPFGLEPRRARAEHGRASAELGVPRRPGWPRTARDLVQAYRDGHASPDVVIRRALELSRSVEATHPGVLLDHADERAALEAGHSAARYERGEPLGELDGVPIVVKEEIDVHGFATRLGTRHMPNIPVLHDAVFVARLRRAGAIVIGQTPMTEYGLSPLGANPHRTMPRNAHDSRRLAGGSSTGSAVACALGLVPLALGTDGGGSIRVPAGYNGIFGLKPTYGRIPVTGHGIPGGTSVVHFGMLGSSAHELAVCLDLGGGADPGDRASLVAPAHVAGDSVRALGRGVRELRIGVPEGEWRAASSEVAKLGRDALAALERDGAVLVPLELPLAAHAAAIGYLTIAVEALAGLREVWRDHGDELGLDLQLFLGGVERFAADDYVDAQRLREALRDELAKALRAVDVIALPTTANVAPPVTDEEARSSFLDPVALDAACRFAFLGNVVGLPAASAPVGMSAEFLPIGLQILGDAWDEACVLQVVAALERSGAAQLRKPTAAVDLLA